MWENGCCSALATVTEWLVARGPCDDDVVTAAARCMHGDCMCITNSVYSRVLTHVLGARIGYSRVLTHHTHKAYNVQSTSTSTTSEDTACARSARIDTPTVACIINASAEMVLDSPLTQPSHAAAAPRQRRMPFILDNRQRSVVGSSGSEYVHVRDALTHLPDVRPIQRHRTAVKRHPIPIRRPTRRRNREGGRKKRRAISIAVAVEETHCSKKRKLFVFVR